MQIVAGLVILVVCILTGYTMHHGKIMVLWQPNEFIIIGGAAMGAVVIGSGFHGVSHAFQAVKTLATRKPIGREDFLRVLQLLFTLVDMSRKEGVLALEPHVENPNESAVFNKYPEIAKNPKVVSFLTDNLRVIITGGNAADNLESLMDIDMDARNAQEMHPGHIFATVADAMPAFGIVAAVLGIVITMQAIDGPPEEIGNKVGAALIGTFLGVLMAYGIFAPLATAWKAKVTNEEQILYCIRNALLCFARGEPPISCVEAARRQIPPESRPTFNDVEMAMKATPASSA